MPNKNTGNTNNYTTINYFNIDNGKVYILVEDMITQTRAACKTIGLQKLGFTLDSAGTH